MLTSIVVTHSDIVANHMSHCTCHQVRLVRIDIDAQSNRFNRANRVRCCHAGDARKRLATCSQDDVRMS